MEIEKYFRSYKYLRKNKLVIPGIYDSIFKLIMTKHKDYFCFLVNSILNISMNELVEGSFKNVEIPSSNNNFSLVKTDLTYKTNNYLIVVEANIDNNTRLKIRNKVHLGRAIDMEYSNKKDYEHTKVIYQLNFNRRNSLKKELLINLEFWDKKLNVGEKEIFKVEINLDVVKKKYYNNYKLTKLEKALLILVLDNCEEIRKIGRNDSMLLKVGDTIVDYSLDEKRYAELREEELNKNLNMIEGMEKRNKEIAKNLLKLNISLDNISEATGLSIDTINKL